MLSKEEELEVIKSNLTYGELAKKYNVKKEHIRYIFKKHKVKAINATRDWIEEEERYLKENYLVKSDFEIGQFLKRTAVSILKKRIKLELHRKDFHILYNLPERYWTNDEINFLIENIDKLTFDEIATKLNKSVKSIVVKASKLKLLSKDVKWSEREDDVLKNYSRYSCDQIAFILDRTKKAVVHRAAYLNIKLGKFHLTSIEQKIKNILDAYKVTYRFNIKLGPDFNFKADFVINKIVIEVHGNYWHGNPAVYEHPNEMQRTAIEKDRIKKEYFESLGYTVYEIWETEIEYDINKIKLFIKKILNIGDIDE